MRPLSVRARAALALVSASRHGTDRERRRWLFRFCTVYGVSPAGIDWGEPVQKIPFSIIRVHLRRHPDREWSFLTVCINIGEDLPEPVPNPVPGLVELDTSGS